MIKETKKELQQTKENLIKTFANELEKIKVTKKELEEYRKRLIADGVNELEIKRAVKHYPINKKLAFIIQEKSIHENIDKGIEFLSYVIKELIKDGGEDTKENNS